MMKAIIIGATGAVGKDLLLQLLDDDRYDSVVAFVRRDPGIVNDKLTVRVIDFEHPEQWKDEVCGDVLYSCLGTTLKQAGGKRSQWRVDYDYQLAFAEAAAQNGVEHYALVSSMGANSHSMNFYMKMKGALEDAVRQLSFRHIVIVQPPSLIRKDSDRLGERLSVSLLKGLNSIGLLRGFRPIATETVARAMRALVASGQSGVEVLTNQEIAAY